MREIKFRAWDKMYNCWLDNFAWPYGHSGLWLDILSGELTHIDEGGDNDISYTPFQDIALCQYTGLKDKNGKEIYEGDVLKPWSDEIGPYWVVFENGSFVCYHRRGRWGLLSRVFEADILKDYAVEVIGSIYENPELLEKEAHP